jgi:hypothetical protein
VELITEYVKKHSKGNPTFSLEKWAEEPDFVAFPTLGEILTPEKLDSMPIDEVEQIEAASKARHQEALASLKRRSKDWRYKA